MCQIITFLIPISDTENDGEVITKGCHRQTDYTDIDIEACFCTGHRCNGAHRNGNHASLALLLVAMATLVFNS